jgi:hypothetical protein
MKRRHSYTAYAIGWAIAWALVWMTVWALGDKDKLYKLRFFFVGWASGWTSATIARCVYPPPKHRPPTS